MTGGDSLPGRVGPAAVASPWASIGAAGQAESLPSIWQCLLAVELFNILMSPFVTSSTGPPGARRAGGQLVRW